MSRFSRFLPQMGRGTRGVVGLDVSGFYIFTLPVRRGLDARRPWEPARPPGGVDA